MKKLAFATLFTLTFILTSCDTSIEGAWFYKKIEDGSLKGKQLEKTHSTLDNASIMFIDDKKGQLLLWSEPKQKYVSATFTYNLNKANRNIELSEQLSVHFKKMVIQGDTIIATLKNGGKAIFTGDI